MPSKTATRKEGCIGRRKDSSALPAEEEHRREASSSSRDRELDGIKSDRLTRRVD